MRAYYQIKFTTENGSMSMTVPNAAALENSVISSALDVIKISDAIKSPTGLVTGVESVMYCEETRTPIALT